MENNNDNIIMSRIAFERMQAKDERNDKWRVVNEVMDMLKVTEPNIYRAVIHKLNNL